MQPHDLESVARQFAAGELSIDEFVERVRRLPSASASTQLPTATLDLDRGRRCGFPEVIFGEGKPVETLREIIGSLAHRGQDVLATRIAPAVAKQLVSTFTNGCYNELGRTFRVPGVNAEIKSQIGGPNVAVITAGTSDLPVAEEARETLDWMGVRVTMIHDVGVAGPHRLPARLSEFERADAIVVVAGMEGALPSIVGGYVACPVIAVPTSVGYGTSFNGVAALLSMLNSCASNVAVVNIDAGFKGGYLAGLIATRCRVGKNAECGMQNYE